MSLQSFRIVGVFSLALFAAALSAQPAAAQQQGWPFSPQHRWWEGGSSRSVRSFVPSQAPSVPAVAAIPPAMPAPASTQIQVKVPGAATVWFDGTATAQTGAARTFVATPLAPGYVYSYAVRIQWQENGQVMERSRTINFRAGDSVSVDFTMPQMTVSR